MLSELLTKIGDFLDYLNNYIQFFLVTSAVLAGLFLFILPYLRPLRSLLSDMGLTWIETIRVLWLCYKSPRTLLRVYIELALIRSRGRHQSKLWWKKFRRVFKRFIDEHQSTGVFRARLNTCFDATTSEFYEQVKKYFDYFRNQKAGNKFGVLIDEPASFIIQIEIDEGFIVPLTFIIGLNDRYNEDWEKILNNYYTAFLEEKNIEESVLPEELCFTFNWLMWGPSYQIDYLPQKHKLIQYGFGDESNSLNIVLRDDETGRSLWEMFSLEGDLLKSKFGYNCKIRGRLCDSRDYYDYRKEVMDIKAMSFLRRLSSDSLGVSFLLELDHFEISHNLKSDNYFFSSYLWIMFALESKTELSFNPANSVTFFEHSNIANTSNYMFLAETLIDKCFRHFDFISMHSNLNKRKYRFCLAVNSYIKELFIKKLCQRRKEESHQGWYTTNIIAEPIHSISEVLDALDNYFVPKAREYYLTTLVHRNKKSISILCDFYASLYFQYYGTESGFSFNGLLNILANRSDNFKAQFHVATGENGYSIGGAVSLWLKEPGCGIIDSVLISESARGTDLENVLLFNARNFITGEKLRAKGNKSSFILARFSPNLDEQYFSYVKLLSSNGFIMLDEGFNEHECKWAISFFGNEGPETRSEIMINKALQLYNKIRRG